MRRNCRYVEERLYSMTAVGPVLDLVADDTAVACPSGAPEAWRWLHEEEKCRADTADGRAELWCTASENGYLVCG